MQTVHQLIQFLRRLALNIHSRVIDLGFSSIYVTNSHCHDLLMAKAKRPSLFERGKIAELCGFHKITCWFSAQMRALTDADCNQIAIRQRSVREGLSMKLRLQISSLLPSCKLACLESTMEQQEKVNLDSHDITQLYMHGMEMYSMHHSERGFSMMILFI